MARRSATPARSTWPRTVELRGHKAEVTSSGLLKPWRPATVGLRRDGTARIWYWRGRLRSTACSVLERLAAVAAVRRREWREGSHSAVLAWLRGRATTHAASPPSHSTRRRSPRRASKAWVSVWHGRSGDCLHTLPFAAAEPATSSVLARSTPAWLPPRAMTAVSGCGTRAPPPSSATSWFPVRARARKTREAGRADVLDACAVRTRRPNRAHAAERGPPTSTAPVRGARLELAPSEQFFASEVHAAATCTATRRIRPRRCSRTGSRPVLCDAQLSPLDDAWQRQPETFVERPAGFDAEQVALERQARERQAIEEAEEGEAGAPALPPGGRRGTAAAAAAGSSSPRGGQAQRAPLVGRRAGAAWRAGGARRPPRRGMSTARRRRRVVVAALSHGDEARPRSTRRSAASSDDDGVDDEATGPG